MGGGARRRLAHVDDSLPTLSDLLTAVGYQRIEALPGAARWWAMIGPSGESVRTLEMDEALRDQDFTAIEENLAVSLPEYLLIVHRLVDASAVERLTTWAFSCPTEVVAWSDLVLAAKPDEDVRPSPAVEDPQTLLRRPGENDLAVLERLRPRLLDLSLRNPLLNFRASSRCVRIVDEIPRMVLAKLDRGLAMRLDSALIETPSIGTPKRVTVEVGNEPASQVTGNVDDDDTQQWILPEDPGGSALAAKHTDDVLQTALPKKSLSSTANTIYRDQETAIESTGTNPLYLAMGFLHWYESPDEQRPRLAPLLLLPIEIQRREVKVLIPVRRGEPGWDPAGPALQKQEIREYQFDVVMSGEEVVLNECLIRKMQDFRLIIPPLPADEQMTGLPNPEAYFKRVATAVARLPTDKRWMVRREMAIGFFSFVKLLEWQDLDPTQWKAQPDGLLERLLGGRDGDAVGKGIAEEHVDDFHLQSPMPVIHEADSTQTMVLMRVAAGENLVVQGPPGTGKTQTIVNLIANAIQRGKKVLFVAEKLAALQAAREKLDHAQLGAFCLELHSHKATSSSALKALGVRLAMDRVHDGRLDAARSQVSRARNILNGYAAIMAHSAGHGVDTFMEALWRLDIARTRFQDGLGDQATPPEWRVAQPGRLSEDLYKSAKRIAAAVAKQMGESVPSRCRAWHSLRFTTVLGRPEAGLVSDRLRRIADALSVVPNLQEQSEGCPIWQVPAPGWAPVAAGMAASAIPGEVLQKAVTAAGETLQSITAARDRIRQVLQWRASLVSVLPHLPETGNYEQLLRALADVIACDQGGLFMTSLASVVADCERLADAVAAVRRHGEAFLARCGLPLQITWRHHALLPGMVQASRAGAGCLLDVRMVHGSMRSAVARGRTEQARLNEMRTGLERLLVLDDLPGNDQLKELRQVFRARPLAWCAFLGIGPLARARRTIRAYIRSAEEYARHDPAQVIDRVLEWRTQVAEFNDERAYAVEIGPVFAGMKTPWVELEAACVLADSCITLYGHEVTRQALDRLRAGAGQHDSEDALLAVALAELAAVHDLTSPLWSLVSPERQSPTTNLAQVESEARVVTLRLREIMAFVTTIPGLCRPTTTIQTLHDVVSHVVKVQRLVRVVDTDPVLPTVFGPSYRGLDSDLNSLDRSLAWATAVRTNVPHPIRDWILSDDSSKRFRDLSEIANEIHRRLVITGEHFSALASHVQWKSGVFADLATTSCLPVQILEAVKAALQVVDELPTWSLWCQQVIAGERLGLGDLLAAAESGTLSGDGFDAAIDMTAFGRLVDALVQEHPYLASFDRTTFDTVRAEFRVTDRSLIAHGRRRVAALLQSMPVPEGVSGAKVSQLTELKLVRNELNKKIRHVPIRQLIQRAGKAVLALTPCLMMSPLSVAQFLPRVRGMFDLVIMDEASQICPEDAFGALLRGQQAVIVGDNKQMPPSDFFKSAVVSAAAGDGLLAGSSCSILDLAQTAFPSGCARLRWHYRSHHESLIQFSNAKYYDNELVIFPSKRTTGADIGIHWVPIPDGRFSGGINRVEAEAVAAEIIAHAMEMGKRPPADRQSLLVVTMNAEQNKLVRDLVDTASLRDSAVSDALKSLMEIPERLMIKNLENVQGDERDRVMIGFTYGPDPQSGKPRQHFGPINQFGGERRLNVLFSRAKQSITVFSSLEPEHIIPSPNSHRGVHDLKDYLTYAKTGRLPDRGIRTRREPDSDFEIAVGAAVRRLGYEPVFQVGVANYFIDIGVIDPASPMEYLLGVECDGATYHSSRCARDRDRLRQDIIESRGWALHRIWSTSWFRDRFTEERRLGKALEEARLQRAKLRRASS